MKKKEKAVFEISDVLGNRTLLWKSVLKYHILLRHPSAGVFIEKVKESLIDPFCVIEDKYGAYLFYKKLDPTSKQIIGTEDNYLMVCSKPKGKFRFIASYYAVSKIKGGKTKWQKRK